MRRERPRRDTAAAHSLLPVDRARRAPVARPSERFSIDREEHDYGSRLRQQEPAGEIELFGEGA
jgi:hypothetical protein